MGKAPNQPTEKKNKPLSVRLNAAEEATLNQMADHTTLGASTLVRLALQAMIESYRQATERLIVPVPLRFEIVASNEPARAFLAAAEDRAPYGDEPSPDAPRNPGPGTSGSMAAAVAQQTLRDGAAELRRRAKRSAQEKNPTASRSADT